MARKGCDTRFFELTDDTRLAARWFLDDQVGGAAEFIRCYPRSCTSGNPWMTRIDYDTAMDLVRDYLGTRSSSLVDDDLVILDQYTHHLPFGWVFFYQSRRFTMSGDPGDMLGGNAPLLVEKSTGRIHELGTASPLEIYLRPFAEKHASSPPDAAEARG